MAVTELIISHTLEYFCTKNVYTNIVILKLYISYQYYALLLVFLEMRNLIYEVEQGSAMLALGWVTALCCS